MHVDRHLNISVNQNMLVYVIYYSIVFIPILNESIECTVFSFHLLIILYDKDSCTSMCYFYFTVYIYKDNITWQDLKQV